MTEEKTYEPVREPVESSGSEPEPPPDPDESIMHLEDLYPIHNYHIVAVPNTRRASLKSKVKSLFSRR